MDPAKIPFFLSKPNPFIGKSDANYVQVIHTSFYGLNERIGHVDIFVDYKSNGGQAKHALALYVHVATATRRLFMIADEKGNNSVIKGKKGQKTPAVNKNQCLIGLYGSLDKNNDRKRYNFDLTKDKILFWHTVCEYKHSEMFFMEEPDDDTASFADITESSLNDDIPMPPNLRSYSESMTSLPYDSPEGSSSSSGVNSPFQPSPSRFNRDFEPTLSRTISPTFLPSPSRLSVDSSPFRKNKKDGTSTSRRFPPRR